jgi:hypothetical protein
MLLVKKISSQIVEWKMALLHFTNLEDELADDAAAAAGFGVRRVKAIPAPPENIGASRAGDAAMFVEQDDLRSVGQAERLDVGEITHGLEAGIPVLRADPHRGYGKIERLDGGLGFLDEKRLDSARSRQPSPAARTRRQLDHHFGQIQIGGKTENGHRALQLRGMFRHEKRPAVDDPEGLEDAKPGRKFGFGLSHGPHIALAAPTLQSKV